MVRFAFTEYKVLTGLGSFVEVCIGIEFLSVSLCRFAGKAFEKIAGSASSAERETTTIGHVCKCALYITHYTYEGSSQLHFLSCPDFLRVAKMGCSEALGAHGMSWP